MDEKKIRNAIAVLREAGLEHYKPEYRKDANEGEAIGMALAWRLSPQDIAQLAYSAWEDVNAHDACRWLNWFWRLYSGMTRDDVRVVVDTASRKITVFGDWLPDMSEHEQIKVSIKATAKELSK